MDENDITKCEMVPIVYTQRRYGRSLALQFCIHTKDDDYNDDYKEKKISLGSLSEQYSQFR